MAFSDHFVGVVQSRWTGYAILAAIIAVALSILFGKENISLGKRVLVIVIMFLLALPTIALVLFEINCLVSGTSKGPYCGWYAWLIAAITILYCILLIIVSITLKAYEKKVEEKAENFVVDFEQANMVADSLMKTAGMEGFENEKKEKAMATNVEKPESSPAKVDKEPETFSKNVAVVEQAPKKNGKSNKKEEENFADYSYGAAPVEQSANMYML
jgi:hypothetical protein